MKLLSYYLCATGYSSALSLLLLWGVPSPDLPIPSDTRICNSPANCGAPMLLDGIDSVLGAVFAIVVGALAAYLLKEVPEEEPLEEVSPVDLELGPHISLDA